MNYNSKIMKKNNKILVVLFWVKNGNSILMKMATRPVVGGFPISTEKPVMSPEVDLFFLRPTDGVSLTMLVILTRLGSMSQKAAMFMTMFSP